MAEADRLRWNQRYARRRLNLQPNARLAALAGQLPAPGPGVLALDLAAGAGRNTLFLAGRGYRVVAVDLADVALGLLDRAARRRRLGDRIEVISADLEAVGRAIAANEPPPPFLAPATYAVIVVSYFLERNLFGALADALRPGGMLFYETFVDGPAHKGSGRNPAHLLAPGELKEGFAELRAIYWQEDMTTGIATLLATKTTQK